MAKDGGPSRRVMGAAPIALLVVQRARLAYALDRGHATIAAEALSNGPKPSSHDATITHAVVDRQHVVEWRLLQNGKVASAKRGSREFLASRSAEGRRARRSRRDPRHVADVTDRF